jgi:biotin transporter BioY
MQRSYSSYESAPFFQPALVESFQQAILGNPGSLWDFLVLGRTFIAGLGFLWLALVFAIAKGALYLGGLAFFWTWSVVWALTGGPILIFISGLYWLYSVSFLPPLLDQIFQLPIVSLSLRVVAYLAALLPALLQTIRDPTARILSGI